jgi:cyclic pyranopterin phosphate synthase
MEMRNAEPSGRKMAGKLTRTGRSPGKPVRSLAMGARKFSHLDQEGRARMVDVSAKPVTRRVAEASCRVVLSAATVARLAELPKGDAVAVARLAGIQGAKRTGELVPLAHPLPLDQVEIEIEPAAAGGVTIRSRVVATARTGAELEALTACATAALALYDMVKAVERGAEITDLRLETKSGGKSGDYRRADTGHGEPARRPSVTARKTSETRNANATRKARER